MRAILKILPWLISNRQSWATATFKFSAQFMSKLLDIFISEIEAIKSVSGLLPSLIVQIIRKDEISAFYKNGGNALGITYEDGPLIRKRFSTAKLSPVYWIFIFLG